MDTQPNKILFVLLLIFVFSHIDRQLVAILLPPIKADFGLSDTQPGFLTGTAFAIFYTLFGIPSGWLADRFNRHHIIPIAFAL